MKRQSTLIELLLVVLTIVTAVAFIAPWLGGPVASGYMAEYVPWRFRFVSDTAPGGISGVEVECGDDRLARHTLTTQPARGRKFDVIRSGPDGVAEGYVLFHGSRVVQDGVAREDSSRDWGRRQKWTFTFTHPACQRQTLTVVAGELLETGKNPVTIRLLPRKDAPPPTSRQGETGTGSPPGKP